MKVIIIEKMFMLCIVYNTLLLFLNTYINHRKNYKQMFMLSLIFSVLDIVSLYIGNTFIYILFMILFFAVPIYLTKTNFIRELFIICGLVFLCVGVYAIIPFSNVYINICVVLISVAVSGIIPIFSKNRYIRTTTVSLVFPDGKKISALIDTGIVTEISPLIIIKHSCLSEIAGEAQPLYALDIGTVEGYSNMGSFVVDEIEVNIEGRKQKIANATVAVTISDLPWDALISAQGLV